MNFQLKLKKIGKNAREFMVKMEFEEMQDMIITLMNRKPAEALSSNSDKIIKIIEKSKNQNQEIIKTIFLLFYLADKLNINLEDALLNKIEDINKK